LTELSEYLIEEGYSKTNLYNDPSGAAMSADTHLDDINRVALKLYNYDFVKECVGKSTFSIQTPQGEFTWKNTNKFLDKKSPYYNENVKGIKTGTMASSYNIVVLYKKDGKEYLITCLASLSDEGRYKAVQSAINTIIK
jgi:serine-type D-Ala-D-Ala carboxypeptidase